MMDRKKYRRVFGQEDRYACTECDASYDERQRIVDHFDLVHDDPGGVLVRAYCTENDCDFHRVYHDPNPRWAGATRSSLEVEASRAIAGHKSHYPNHGVKKI